MRSKSNWHETYIKNRCKKQITQKNQKKLNLEASWAPFWRGWEGLGRLLATLGRLLGTSWAPLGPSWAPLGRFLGVQNRVFLSIGPRWSPKGLLDRFWEGLGRIWMRFGRIWAFKIKAFASHGHFLNTLDVPCCLTLCYRNPRAASLRLAERHN